MVYMDLATLGIGVRHVSCETFDIGSAFEQRKRAQVMVEATVFEHEDHDVFNGRFGSAKYRGPSFTAADDGRGGSHGGHGFNGRSPVDWRCK